jgi:diadenosine tetraphosphate (Ap4A) HIT family hydrolase
MVKRIDALEKGFCLAHDAAWTLHAQLGQDCARVGDLPLSRVLLFRDANYPWLILVPRIADASEVFDLADAARTQLMREIADSAQALKRITGCDKINVAAIGNMVPQLHVHVGARRKDDPAWPGPVWGHAPARPYDVDALAALLHELRGALGLV